MRRGIRCLTAVEQNTAQLISLVDPELLLALSAFHLRVYDHLIGGVGLYWLADENWATLEWLRRTYRDRPGAPSPVNEDKLAGLEVTVGGTLQRLGLIGQLRRARDSFERAARFASENDVPRYWLGFVEEKLGGYRRAAPHFHWLIERRPFDHEAALRLAILHSRLNRRAEAIERLTGLAAGASRPWIRVVAVQKLARLLSPSQPELALARLREVQASLGDEPSLTLQIVELLGDSSAEGEALLTELLQRRARAGVSPRLLYEEARTEGIEAEMESFDAFVLGKLPDLLAAVDTVERLKTIQGALKRHGSGRPGGLRTGFENPNRERPVFQDCSSFKVPRRK